MEATASMQLKLVSSVALAALGLGLAPLAKKSALTTGTEPLVVAVASSAIGAALAIGIFAASAPKFAVTNYPRRMYFSVLVVGMLGSGAVVLLGILAMTQTSATNRSLFQAMYPVATAVFARLLLGESFRSRIYWTIGLMCAGLFMVNSGPAGINIGRSFWLLAATLPLIGLADVYAKKTLAKADPGFVATGRLAFGTLFLLACLPWITPDQWRQSAVAWGWLLVAGVSMAAGALGFYRAMQLAGASLAAAFISLAPVITLTAEWFWLDATFGLRQLAGISLVVSGAILLAYQNDSA